MTIVTPRSGFDLEYYIDRTMGEKTAGGYYLNAAQQGEPPGRWFGKGAEALGFTDGQTVERDPYLAAYQQTDPRTGDKLGGAPNGYPRFRQIFARKLAASRTPPGNGGWSWSARPGRRRAGRPCTPT